MPFKHFYPLFKHFSITGILQESSFDIEEMKEQPSQQLMFERHGENKYRLLF